MSLQRKSAERPGRMPGSGQVQLVKLLTEAVASVQGAREEGEIGFLKLRAVCQRTTLSKGQIYKLMAVGAFPKPVELSEKRRAWVEKEIIGWMDEKVRGRESGPF